jgi:hypothetical protein
VIETMPNDARYFAGLTAWRPGELDDEIRAGAWEVRPADASTVFRADPGSLWRDLHTGPQGPGRRARAPLVGASLAPASWASAEMAAAAQDSIGN